MSTETLPRPVGDVFTDAFADIAAKFQESVPCQDCEKPARLRSLGHYPFDCGKGDPPPYLKCLDCYHIWRTRLDGHLATFGCFTCNDCLQIFTSVEPFSDYREF